MKRLIDLLNRQREDRIKSSVNKIEEEDSIYDMLDDTFIDTKTGEIKRAKKDD